MKEVTKQQKRPQKQHEENLRQINEHSEIIPNRKSKKIRTMVVHKIKIEPAVM